MALRDIYVDSLTFDSASAMLAVEKHGETRVLFGTDYPFALGAVEPYGEMNLSTFAPALRDAAANENVLAFLGETGLELP